MEELKIQIDIKTICPEGTSEEIKKKISDEAAKHLWEDLLTEKELQSIKEDGAIIEKIEDDLVSTITIQKVDSSLQRLETKIPWEIVIEELKDDEEAIN
jgi:hypothetical protein